MLEETGIVTAIEVDSIRVQTQIKTTCGGCQQNNDCGTGVVARAFAPKSEDLIIPFNGDIKVGQQVTLGIPENSLLTASALVYMLPLVVMVITVIIANALLHRIGLTHEVWVILAALTVVVSSFVLVRQHLKSKKHRYLPQLLAILPPHISVKNLNH